MCVPEPRKRPLGVVIRAAVVIAIGTVLTFLGTLAVLATLTLVALGDPNARALLLLAILALAFAIVILVAGIGLYNLRPWAWWLAVIALSFQLLSYVARPGVSWSPSVWDNLPWIIPALSLAYLVAVRRHFR